MCLLADNRQDLAAFSPSARGGALSGGETDGFEKVKAGEFQKLETALGTWKTETGRALVDPHHAKTGRQCLQLAGGKKTSVVLELKEKR